MGTRMQQRRGTSAEWAAANVILAEGEVGWDKTTGEIRMGDGVTHWVDLPDSARYIPKSTLDATYVARGLVNAAGDLLIGSADDTLVRLAPGGANQVLTIVGGVPVWQSLPAEDNPLVVIGAAGDLIVGTGDDAAARLPKGTDGQVLSVVAGVVTWVTPATSNDLEVLYWTGP